MFFKTYIQWIILFVIIEGSLLVIGLLDQDVSHSALVYMMIVIFFIFTLSILIDYVRRRPFLTRLRTLTLQEIELLNPPTHPEDQEIYNTLINLSREHKRALYKKESLAKEIDDDVTRFIHDLKTPLTTMHLLIKDIHHTRLLEEWSKMNHMLTEMLYDKRLPNIKNDLYYEPLDLETIIKNIIGRLRTICMEKNIGFDLQFKQKTVVSDEKWLTFILTQILTNAVNYSDENIIEIYYDKTLTIRDHGRGIAKSDLPHIFEKGFTSTTNKGDALSTGMGLYLSKNVADTLNIDIHVTSTYGEGTTFTLSFSEDNPIDSLLLQRK